MRITTTQPVLITFSCKAYFEIVFVISWEVYATKFMLQCQGLMVVFPAVSVESSDKDTTGYLIKGMKCSLEIHLSPNMQNFENICSKIR